MPPPTLEERVAALETEVSRLKTLQTAEDPPTAVPWWERIRGQFKDDAAYDEAMRLGREYRESLHPKDTEDYEDEGY